MLLVTPLKAAFIDCTEVSQTFSEKEVDTPKVWFSSLCIIRSVAILVLVRCRFVPLNENDKRNFCQEQSEQSLQTERVHFGPVFNLNSCFEFLLKST